MGEDRIINDRYAVPDIRNGLVADWNFGRDLATPIVNKVGPKNLSFSGASRVSAPLIGNRKVLSFDGIDDSATRADSVPGFTDKTSPRTFVLFFNDLKAGNYSSSDINRFFSFKYFFCSHRDGSIRIGVNTNDVTSSIVKVVNRWNFIVGVFTGTHLLFYHNNVLIDSFELPEIVSDRGWYFGYNGDTRFFEGYIDFVRCYNRALSSAEVSHLYKWLHRQYGILPGFND